ncbi:MAG: response regulator transcription factor [Bacteroidia bacterium]|nr:response regulator transcription factor [Bacteroidota bacterium]MBK7969811.1 response regulator transcription factor [Bacteroidota bacterium]MBK9048059.1 response regulator transcription factor [Bacteroidota bacterium]MBP9082954.1 response regulator transcription factor [Bacteroidia bacterium]
MQHTALIVDDENHCADRVVELLNKNPQFHVKVLAVINNVPEAVKYLQTNSPDVLFLDVEIGNETGFDLLKQVGSVSSEIIFTTAYNKYAVQAFKFSAIDYLLKPIDEDDFLQALKRTKQQLERNQSGKTIETLLHNIHSATVQTKKIHVATITGFDVLNVSDIIRCQSDVNYTTIYATNNKPLMVAKTLKDFEDLLTEYDFFRIHNSHLVNLHFVKSYNKGKGGYVILKDNTEIEVSTRRKDDFLKALSKI